MKAKKEGTLFLIFLMMAGLSISAIKQEANSGERKSLVRKELLKIKTKELPSPRRNIFSPRLSKMKNNQLKTEGLLPSKALNMNPSSDTDQTFPSFLDVRYIGFIDNGKKIVALIIFEGEAIAVEEGEKLSAEVLVGKITAKQIEIIGPGSRHHKYSLQGENE